MPDDTVGCNTPIVPRLRVLTKINPKSGAKDAPDQLPPPSELGKTILGTMRYGVSGPSCTALSYWAWHDLIVSGDILLTSSRVMLIRDIGSGLIGNGWVGEVISPGASLAATGLSSTPQIGAPVRRSNTNSKPTLVDCATAGILLPSLVTSTSVGGALTSQSKMSWWVAWKYHFNFPVLASSAMMLHEY